MTRRSKSWDQNTQKNLVDIASGKSVGYRQGEPEGRDKATDEREGIHIDDDVWSEMITVGKFLCLVKEDPDLYDLFDWMRVNLYSGQHYSDYLLTRVDSEIAKELGPWS